MTITKTLGQDSNYDDLNDAINYVAGLGGFTEDVFLVGDGTGDYENSVTNVTEIGPLNGYTFKITKSNIDDGCKLIMNDYIEIKFKYGDTSTYDGNFIFEKQHIDVQNNEPGGLNAVSAYMDWQTSPYTFDCDFIYTWDKNRIDGNGTNDHFLNIWTGVEFFNKPNMKHHWIITNNIYNSVGIGVQAWAGPSINRTNKLLHYENNIFDDSGIPGKGVVDLSETGQVELKNNIVINVSEGQAFQFVNSPNSTVDNNAEDENTLSGVGNNNVSNITPANEFQSLIKGDANYLKLIDGEFIYTVEEYTPGSTALGEAGTAPTYAGPTDYAGNSRPGDAGFYSIGPYEQQYTKIFNEISTAARDTVRKHKAIVEVTWTDSIIDATLSSSANDENRIHTLASDLIDQTTDQIESMTHKWAHLDGVIKADGTYHPAPGNNTEAITNQMGWYGATACDGGAVWPGTNPKLTTTFVARSINGFNVVGDTVYGEYPVSFIVEVFETTGAGAPLFTYTVTDGVGDGWELVKVRELDSVAVRWKKNLSTAINSAEKITLEITKWSDADRIVKISEFYTAVTETYYGDDIVKLSILEENLIADGTLPTGNISANELDLSLQNVEDRFFVGNTASPLHTLLKKNRRIKVWLGVRVAIEQYEYILFGTFFSGDWQADENGTVVTTTARDRMELLRTNVYESSPLSENITLYDLAVLVLDNAKLKIPDLVYNIDIILSFYTVPYGYFDKISYFDCIKLIAGASQSRAYMDRNDVLQIESGL